MLKAILKTLDGVDDATGALYKETTDRQGGTIFVLQVEGINTHPDVLNLKTAHETQKEKNREQATRIASLEARVDGLPDDFDADAYEQLKADAERNGGTGKPDPAEVERIVQERLARATKKHEEKTAVLESQIESLKTQRNNGERDRVLDAALDESGVTDPIFRKAARAMLRERLEVLEDEQDGVMTLSVLALDADLGTKIPATEFIKNWSGTDEGKAFVGARQDSGGGGNGPGGGGRDTAPNPWKADTFNLTQQHRIETDDPQKAARLKAAAGVKN